MIDVSNNKVVKDMIDDNYENILINRKLLVQFANYIASTISKYTEDAITECESEDEAYSNTTLAMLEIFISLYRNCYNIEKIILDKYKIDGSVLNPLKQKAREQTDVEYERIAKENEEETKPKVMKDTMFQ